MKKKNNFLQKLFSVRNEKNSKNRKYKVVTIFGLRLKFKLENFLFLSSKMRQNLLKEKKVRAALEFEQQKKIDQLYKKRKRILANLARQRRKKHYDLTCYVVTYNQEKIIGRCLESILEQDTHYSYLIKILDDASSDRTFDVCLEYAKKYPDKIELNTVKHNSGGKLLTVAYENISTKYFCRIDGDDYWCHKDKIEISLNFLRKHPDYVTYAHDTQVYFTKTGVKKSNIHDFEPNKNVTDEISFDNFFYVHVSGRIHRNVLDFKKLHKNTRKRDRILWYLLLDAGKCFYDDRIMSVYTIGQGFYNSQYDFFKSLSRRLMCYNANKFFKYKYDKSFEKQVNDGRLATSKKFFGVRLGWFMYIFYMKYIALLLFTYRLIKNFIKDVRKQYYNTVLYTDDFQKFEQPTIQKVRDEII